MSDSLRPCGLQHARFLCPLLSPGVGSNSRPFSWWCYLTISSSAAPFSFGLQSFPTSGSFPVNQFFASGGQSIGASASTSVLPMNIQGSLPVGLTGLILLSKALSVFSLSQQFESINSPVLSLLYGPTLTSVYDKWKNQSFDYTDLCWQSVVSAL